MSEPLIVGRAVHLGEVETSPSGRRHLSQRARRALLEEMASGKGKSGACGKCGQVDSGQTGEYPCSGCGLPLTHDEPDLWRAYHAAPNQAGRIKALEAIVVSAALAYRDALGYFTNRKIPLCEPEEAQTEAMQDAIRNARRCHEDWLAWVDRLIETLKSR